MGQWLTLSPHPRRLLRQIPETQSLLHLLRICAKYAFPGTKCRSLFITDMLHLVPPPHHCSLRRKWMELVLVAAGPLVTGLWPDVHLHTGMDFNRNLHQCASTCLHCHPGHNWPLPVELDRRQLNCTTQARQSIIADDKNT